MSLPLEGCGTPQEFNAALDAMDAACVQRAQELLRRAVAARPAVLASVANGATPRNTAPVFTKLLEHQEVYERQLRVSTDYNLKKMREMSEQQRVEFAEMYERERRALLKLLK